MEQRITDLLNAPIDPTTGLRSVFANLQFRNGANGTAYTFDFTSSNSFKLSTPLAQAGLSLDTANGNLLGKWTVTMVTPDDGFSTDPYPTFAASNPYAVVRTDFMLTRINTSVNSAITNINYNITTQLNYPCIVYKGTNTPVRNSLNIFTPGTNDTTDHDLIVLQTYKTDALCLRNRNYNVCGGGAQVGSAFFGASTASRIITARNITFTDKFFLFAASDAAGHLITVERCSLNILEYYGGSGAADRHIFRHCAINYFTNAGGSALQTLILENCTLGGVDGVSVFGNGLGSQKMVVSNTTIRLVGTSKLFPDGYTGPYPRFVNTTLVDTNGNTRLLDAWTPSSVRSAVTTGTFTNGEMQGTQPAGSNPGMKFSDAAYRYEYMNVAADMDGTNFGWVRTAKS